jgi:peptide/nickel transport system substrate-binding protein
LNLNKNRRKKMLRKIVLKMFFIFMLLMLLVFIGSAGTGSNQVIIALDPDFFTFDPGRCYEHFSMLVMNACYDNLVKFIKGKVEPVKHLVESYEVSPDGKVFTFNLRSGVEFVSGNNLSSKDVKWSFDRVKNLKANPSFLAENIDKVETLDEKTVRVYLKKQDGAFLYKLTASAFAILDSELVKSHGGISGVNAATDDTAEEWLNRNSAGSGPYILSKFSPNVETILERNDNYWKGAAPVEKIILKDIPDANTQLLTVQKGDIDIAYSLGEDQIRQLGDAADVDVLPFQTLSMIFLMFNEDSEIGGPMANKDVQAAVEYALDYKGIQTIAGKGAITPMSIIQVGFLGALPPRDPEYTNVEKAKELLVKAGYPNGFSVTLNTINRETEGVDWVILAQKIKEDLSKIGIDAKIRSTELPIGIDEYRRAIRAFRLAGWQPDYLDSNNQLAFLPGEVVGLRANWKADANPKLIQLGEAAMIETDDKKRAEILKEIQEIMVEVSPYIPLLQPSKQIVIKKGLKGIEYSDAYRLEVYTLSW